MHRLRIAVFSDVFVAGSEWQWAALDSANSVLAQGTDNPGEWANTRDIELILPAHRVLFSRLLVPSASRRQLSKILPFALEDELLTPPDGCHLAAGPLQGDSVVVAMVAKDYLARLLRLLADQGIQLRRVVSVMDCVSQEDNVWHGLILGQNSCIRAGQTYFSFDPESAPPVELMLALKQAATQPERLLLHTPDAESLAWQADWSQALSLDVQIDNRWDWRNAPINAGAVNLLQGEFDRSAAVSFDFQAYRIPALLLSVLASLYLGSVVIDWWRLDRQYRAATVALESEARKVIPAGPLVDPLAQLQRKQQDAARSGGAGWTSVAQRIAPLLDSSNLTRFHFADGEAVIALTLPDAAQADALQQRLAATGLQVERKSVAKTATGFTLSLSLKDAH